MKGDFSRVTFNPRKHYNRVLMQQGRVQLDADWNEQRDILQHHIVTQLVDVIGPSGVPKGDASASTSFALKYIAVDKQDWDVLIHPGRIYVEGLLCELEEGTRVAIQRVNDTTVQMATLQVDDRPLAVGQWVEFLDTQGQVLLTDTTPVRGKITQTQSPDGQDHTGSSQLTLASTVPDAAQYLRRCVTYKTQPWWPNPPAPDPNKTFLAYLDVWERVVTALEDADMREVALNGADTATRSQIVWQVRLYPLTEAQGQALPADATAQQVEEAVARFLETTRTPPGQMIARRNGPSATLLDNQLYRVEIHNRSGAFTWARDNASTVARVQNLDAANRLLTIVNEGRNSVSGFVDCPWVELTNQAQQLNGEPGVMLEIAAFDSTTLTLTVKNDALQNLPASLQQASDNVVRRWEGYQPQMPDSAHNDGYTALENAIEIKFDPGSANPGSYQPGDYWLLPVRTNLTYGIEWPPGHSDTPLPVPQPPAGMPHAYCRLALLRTTSDPATVTDNRPQFANLTGGLLSQTGGELRGQLTINQPQAPATFDLVTTQKVFIAADDPNNLLDPKDAVLTVNGDTLIRLTKTFLNFTRLGLTPLQGSGLRGAPYIQLVAGAPSSSTFEPKPFIAFSDNLRGAPYRALIQYTGGDTNTLAIAGKDVDDVELKVNISGELQVNGQKISPPGSDKRWKKNITPIPEALTKVLQLTGVQFDWKADEYPDKHFPSGQQIGLVAQEVEPIVPEAVSTASDGYKTVEYERLVALLIEAIKELKNENEMLKQRVEILEGTRTRVAQPNGHL